MAAPLLAVAGKAAAQYAAGEGMSALSERIGGGGKDAAPKHDTAAAVSNIWKNAGNNLGKAGLG